MDPRLKAEDDGVQGPVPSQEDADRQVHCVELTAFLLPLHPEVVILGLDPTRFTHL
jgi:hypothetical protein